MPLLPHSLRDSILCTFSIALDLTERYNRAEVAQVLQNDDVCAGTDVKRCSTIIRKASMYIRYKCPQ